ncbi:MAG: acetyl/propionyl/methylcrotonyl-CoA carboxylase subunit alpha [Gemmatimonadales bacterium]
MKRVLVANRGEIALRIIRACREEGLESVAAYSEADRHSPHVRAADMARELGPAPASDSYLDIDRVLRAAKESGADAVHPGYGFLAERPEFAQAVEDAGLVFIGPPSEAVRAMGEKTEARRRMKEVGVPIVPGTTEPVAHRRAAVEAAEEIGYPVLLKAAQGMRVAKTAQEVEKGFSQAASEARSAFGDSSVYLERFIERPRHVEIQVMADQSGRTVHLGERECSVQRRHQKLIEESPSMAVDQELREKMGEAAVSAARAVGYVSAGTVEFLLDERGRFYFLEMNTRLQVEHPVTEMVYGVDLVREQLRIARGLPMSVPTTKLSPRGHAIECRITSEDPFGGFLPATGRIEYLGIPGGPGVRWDGGIELGTQVTLHYESLLGKLITWGENRGHAIGRMERALDELIIVGLPTSVPFHRRVMRERSFRAGTYDVGYMERVGSDLLAREPDGDRLELVAVAAALAADEARGVVAVRGGMAGDGRDRGADRWLLAARREALR